MLFQDAHRILQQFLAPMPLDQFLDETLGRRFVKIPGDSHSYSSRIGLLGNNPEQVIIDAFRDLAPNMAFHAAEPKGSPPQIGPVADSRAFKARIEAFHAVGYTVRLSPLRWLSPMLDEFLRALEFFFHAPANVDAFWSRGDAKAPPHHDDSDLIVIQLKGRKRWFVSTDPTTLPNPWKSGPNPPPTLERHEMIEVGPGDILYLPRGTDHRVDALEASLHLSVAFAPLTLREAIGAALDHLSDSDRSFRETVGSRLAYSIRSNDFTELSPRIREGLARLMHACGSDEFIAEAMQRRASRVIGDFKMPKLPAQRPKIYPATLVRHRPFTMSSLTAIRGQIDFSHPGGHIYIHRGVEQSVAFIADTRQFRVGEIPPGTIGDDIRVALVDRFVSGGFLEVIAE